MHSTQSMTKTIPHNKNRPGFTLIEILIYLGLFTLIIGGSLISLMNIIQNTERTQALTQEEANFILSKINWAMDGATNFTVATSTLTISNLGTSLVFSYDGANSDITLKRGSQVATILNNDEVKINGVNFTKISGSPNKLITTLTVDGINYQSIYTTR